MKHKTILFFIIISLSLLGARAYADDTPAFCYVSLVEEDAFVLQEGIGEPKKAVVNFPLMPGDTLYTEGKGRCEIQFDNGTVMRLDKNSKLKIDTLRADSLTTRWTITTLELLAGRLFSMNNTYSREMFQVVTPLAALKMSKDSTTTVSIGDEGTHVYVEKGKIGVLYGDEKKSLKKEFIRAKKGYIITPAHELMPSDKRPNAEFHMWNEYVNNNFKDLHYGISKVPKPIYNFPPFVVEFAKKWSSVYGEWVYNDFLGYVWKPYDESFKYSDRRPFFFADFVRIKDELYVVPQQPWGWVPAHLGTWVWMKKNGWVWIPGTAFTPGMYDVNWLWEMMNGYRSQFFWMVYGGRYGWWNAGGWPYFSRRGYSPSYRWSCCNTLDYWIHHVYGDYQGYETYRREGVEGWSVDFKKRFKKSGEVPGPSFKDVPKQIVGLLDRMNKTPLAELGRHFDFDHAAEKHPDAGGNIQKVRDWLVYRNNILARQNNFVPKDKKLFGDSVKKSLVDKRDWNHDRTVAKKLGVDMVYSSSRNAVLLPELKLSSKTITNRQKFQLRTLPFRGERGLTKSSLLRRMYSGSSSLSGSGVSDSSVGTSVTGHSGRGGSPSTSKSGGGNTTANEKN